MRRNIIGTGLLFVVLAAANGCATPEMPGADERRQNTVKHTVVSGLAINETPPNLAPHRLQLLQGVHVIDAIPSDPVLRMTSTGPTSGSRSSQRFWTLISVEPEAVKTLGVLVKDTILTQKIGYGENGVSRTSWWGRQEPFYSHDGIRGTSFIPAKRLKGLTGTRVFYIKNRALGVQLESNEHAFAIAGVGDLRERRRALRDVPVTPEDEDVAFTYKVDANGRVRVNAIGTPPGTTQATIDQWALLLNQLELRYLGGSAVREQRIQGVHSGRFRVEELVGSGVPSGRHYRIRNYRSELDSYVSKVASMSEWAQMHQRRRNEQVRQLALLEAERVERAEQKAAREKAAALAAKQRAEENDRRRAEAEARRIAAIESKRIQREVEGWPSHAVAKLPSGAWLCLTKSSGDRLFGSVRKTLRTVENSPNDCNPSTRVVFLSEVENKAGRTATVEVIGSGTLYAEPSAIER